MKLIPVLFLALFAVNAQAASSLEDAQKLFKHGSLIRIVDGIGLVGVQGATTGSSLLQIAASNKLEVADGLCSNNSIQIDKGEIYCIKVNR